MGGGGHKIRVYNTGASDKQANWQQIKTDTPDKGTQNTRAANSSLQQGHGHLDSPQHDSKDTDGPQHNSKDTEIHTTARHNRMMVNEPQDVVSTPRRSSFVFLPAVPGEGAFWLNCQDGHAGKRFLTERSVQSLNAYTSVQK